MDRVYVKEGDFGGGEQHELGELGSRVECRGQSQRLPVDGHSVSGTRKGDTWCNLGESA